MPADYGTIQSISYYMRGGGSDSLAIWNTAGTLILLSTMSITAPSSAGWATSTYVTAPVLVANTTYCVGYTSGGTATFYYFDASTANNFYIGDSSAGGGTPTNLTNMSNATGRGGGQNGSFYISYTPAAAGPAVSLYAITRAFWW